MKNNSYDEATNKKIDINIAKIKKAKPYSSTIKRVSRKDFLNLTYEYLVFNNTV